MSYMFSDETIAFRPCPSGYAIVSNKKEIFFDKQTNIGKILESAGNIIIYDFQDVCKYVKGLRTDHDLKTLYYHLHPDKNINSMKDIIKNEYYRTTTKNATMFVKTKEAYKAIEEAKFILEFYLEQFYKAYKLNKKLLYSDNQLIQSFEETNKILVDQVAVRSLLSEYNLEQWNLERSMWKETKFPFYSISSIENPSVQLKEQFEQIRKIKSNYQSLVKYLDVEELQLNFDFTNGLTARTTTKSQLGSFIPDKQYRHIFHSIKGHKFLSFDYSKQEASILAYVSEDKRLKKDLEHENFYQLLAKKFFGQPNKENGKTLFYGLIYGAQSKTIANVCNVEISQAIDAKEELEERYSKAYEWITEEATQLDENFYGRKILNPCANSYLQSTAADLVRQKLLETSIYNPIIVLADEIIYQVPDSSNQLLKNIKRILEEHSSFNLKVLAKESTNLKF